MVKNDLFVSPKIAINLESNICQLDPPSLRSTIVQFELTLPSASSDDSIEKVVLFQNANYFTTAQRISPSPAHRPRILA